MPKKEEPKAPEIIKLAECPSCLSDSALTSPVTLHWYNPPVTLHLCPPCHTQAIRQPITFRLRFSPRSGDHIKSSVQEILDAAKTV